MRMLLVSNAAGAQECLLPPAWVPGLSGAPTWFAGSAGVAVRPELDDPRWGGAPIRKFPTDPTGADAAFRHVMYVVYEGGSYQYILSVTLQALFDDNGASANDAVYFGISNALGAGSASQARLVRIRPSLLSSVNPSAPSEYTVFSCDGVPSGTWQDCWSSADGSAPSWLTEMGTWRGYMPASNPENAKLGGSVWGVAFKINLSALGLDPSSQFRVFRAVDIEMSGGNLVHHTDPKGISSSWMQSSIPVPANPYATSNGWVPFDPIGNYCVDGANLSWPQIGVLESGSSLGSNIQTSLPNTFRAQPDVSGLTFLERGRLLATFSIANWGATIADPTAPWDVFSYDQPWVEATQSMDYSCVQAVGAPNRCPQLGVGQASHQCIQVQLRSAGADVPFASAAAYRNMDFVTLSSLSREATISIEGLQAITGVARDRDVYLYVQKRNMPSQSNESLVLDGEALWGAREAAEVPPVPNIGSDGPVVVRPTQSPHQILLSTWPSYVVHPYYDTSETIAGRGAVLKQVVPMIPFGYFAEHRGRFYGFADSLQGAQGVVVEQLSEDLYKVRVPNESAVKVVTTLVAAEVPARSLFSSFEDVNRPWVKRSGLSVTTSNANATDGNWSWMVDGCGYEEIRSPLHSSTEWGQVGDELAVDVYVPRNVSNPYWVGDIALALSAVGTPVQNVYLGRADLTRLTRGSWNRISVPVSASVRDFLLGDVPNVQISLIVNHSVCGTERLMVDHVRFEGNLIQRTVFHDSMGLGSEATSPVFSFDHLEDWTCSQCSLSLEPPGTEGDASLGVQSSGWSMVKSRPFDTSELIVSGNQVSVDLYLPAPQPNPYWVGDMQMYVSCPRSGIYGQYLGYQSLMGAFWGEFNTLSFSLSPSVVAALRTSQLCQVAFALNVANGAGKLRLDNLRFGVRPG